MDKGRFKSSWTVEALIGRVEANVAADVIVIGEHMSVDLYMHGPSLGMRPLAHPWSSMIIMAHAECVS